MRVAGHAGDLMVSKCFVAEVHALQLLMELLVHPRRSVGVQKGDQVEIHLPHVFASCAAFCAYVLVTRAQKSTLQPSSAAPKR